MNIWWENCKVACHIKNADNLTMIPKNAETIPELKEAYTLASMNTWTEEELEVYECWQIRDAEDNYKIQEEFEKGEVKAKIEVAQKMKQKGMPVEDIIEITGLSREDLERV